MNDTQFRTCWQEAGNYSDRDAYVSDLALSSMWQDDPEADVPTDRIDRLAQIWTVSHMTMRDIRNASGLTQAAFSEKFLIPKRTVENWDAVDRVPPDYVKLMIARQLNLV